MTSEYPQSIEGFVPSIAPSATTFIKFVQYVRPTGARRDVWIERPPEVVARAAAIVEAGFHLECEELSEGTVSVTVGDDDGDYAIQLVANGPNVPETVDALLMENTVADLVRRREERLRDEEEDEPDGIDDLAAGPVG